MRGSNILGSFAILVRTGTKLNKIIIFLLGTLFSNMKLLEVDPVAEDSQMAAKMLAVSSYWSGLVNKEDLIKNKDILSKITKE